MQLIKEIERIDAAGEDGTITLEEEIEKDSLLKEYNSIVVSAEEHLKLQSRILWLKAGDSNSKFFHRVVKGRRQHNYIRTMRIGYTLMEGDTQIRMGVTNYFTEFFKEEINQPFPEALNVPSISTETKELYDSNFTDSEIWEAIKSSKGDKAPGPDEFTFDFYKNCWNVIKPDILLFLREIQNRNFTEWRMNNTFIALLPKSASALDVKEYRPICLINCGYRIFSKVLTCRLKLVLNDDISQYQGADLPSRNILDGVLIASESIDAKICEGKARLICKLDIEKAFDNLNWNFLLQSLQHMGFGECCTLYNHDFIALKPIN